MMETITIAIRICLLLLSAKGFQCLRDVRLIVPEAAERGSKVEMKCLYDLEKEELYTVKWYRGDREFYRYAPREVPPIKIFKIPGIDVDESATDGQRLTIIPRLRRVAEGFYTCEVSADAPSFVTAQVHTHMYIVDLPKEGPELHGIKLRYRPGMKLKAECISRNALPAANISFFVNSERALSQHVMHRVDGKSPNGLMTAYSTIQFEVKKHHFIGERIKIRCTAYIYEIYVKSHEKSAIEIRVTTTPSTVMEPHEVVVYSKHHAKKTNTGTTRTTPGTISCVLSVITFLLPNTII